MNRFIPYILYLFLIGFHQVIFKDVTQLFETSINLPVLIVILISIYKSEITSVWFGFFASLVVAATVPNLTGWLCLIMSLLALASHQMCQRLNLDSMLSRLLLIAAAIFIYNVILLIINYSDSFLYLLLMNSLLGAIYTTIVAWIFFMFKDGHVTYQKIKAIF